MILAISCQTTVLQNNSQCLLLNIVNKCDTRYFEFIRQNKNTKNEHARIKRKKI